MRLPLACALWLAACAGRTPSAVDPATPPPARRPVPAPEDDLVYFVMVDRFANGDPSNDGAVDPADPQAFHGGDLAGVRRHLDEIQALGVRTVWLSPVFRMRTAKFFEWGAFHGYWIEDPHAIEPRFGTEADLVALSEDLHRRGMRLLLDVVWNHVAPDSALLQERPGWFHPRLPVEDWSDPVQVVEREVHGLPDLAQEHEEVHAWLRDAALHWIRVASPDGYRVDAVRHMPSSFLARLGGEIRAEAGPGFTLLGEDFQGDAARLGETARATGFDTMFDFPLHYALVDAMCGDRPLGRVAATLSLDRFHPDGLRLVTFLDNHDRPRIASACGGDLDRVRAALGLLFALRGTPCLTWGTESGLTGAEEPANRADMDWARRPLSGDLWRLASFRWRHPSLLRGATEILDVESDRLLLRRVLPGEAALVVVNLSDEGFPVPRALLDGGRLVAEAEAGPRVVVRPASPLLDGGGPAPVPPGTVWIGILEPTGAGFVPPDPTPVPIRVVAQGVPLGPGDTLLLAGAGSELGNWDPARAPAFAPGEGGLALALDLPQGAVVEAKLVIRRADGRVDWQAGENRYHRVEARRAPVPWTW